MEHKINIMLSGIIYYVASLNINRDTQEIFYSPKSTNKDCGWDLNQNKMGGTIDHFSFHKNGKVHGKFKEINRDKKNRGKMPLYQNKGTFSGGIPNELNKVRHMVIDSIYQIDGKWFLESITDNNEYICALEGFNQFSLVLVLMPRLSSAFDVLHCDGIACLQVKEDFLEIPINSDWKVVVYITWQVLPRITSESITLPSFNSQQRFNREIVVPSTPLAYQHLSLCRLVDSLEKQANLL